MAAERGTPRWHSRKLRIPTLARQLGCVPGPARQRSDPCARARDRAAEAVLQRPRVVHRRQQLHPRPGAGDRQPLCRLRLQFDGNRVRGRRRQSARRMDRRRRADARSMAGRHPPICALQRQRELAARPDRRGARHALQDAVAESGTRKRAAVPPLAAVLATAATRRLLRFEDGLGARQLLRAFDSAGAHRVRLGTPELARLGRGRASRVPRSGCGVRYELLRQVAAAGARRARRAAVAGRQRRAGHSGFHRLYGNAERARRLRERLHDHLPRAGRSS